VPDRNYSVVFEGALRVDGVEREATQMLAALFRETPEGVGKLLDGQPRVVAASLTRTKAEEYAGLLCGAGVAARISDSRE
jgi:hypothetical protein